MGQIHPAFKKATHPETDQTRYLYYSAQKAEWPWPYGAKGADIRSASVGSIPDGKGGRNEIVYTNNSPYSLDASTDRTGDNVLVYSGPDVHWLRKATAADVARMNKSLIPEIRYLYYSAEDAKRPVADAKGYIITGRGNALVGSVPDGKGGRKEIVYTNNSPSHPGIDTDLHPDKVLAWSGKAADFKYVRKATIHEVNKANNKLSQERAKRILSKSGYTL